MSNVLQNLRELVSGRQNSRILRLSFPRKDGPTSQLLVNKLDAFESMSRDFEFTLELLSDSATLELKDLQGKLFSVELVRQDGSLRYFSGYCFEFRLVKSNGSISFYEAKLAPWLKYLSLRKDNYLFHNKTLQEQTDLIFRDYGANAEWECRVRGDDPAMTDACQFDESDFNYVSRRWEAAGWMYWYEHSATGHKLILSDDSISAVQIDGNAEIRFQRHGGSEEENGIGDWSPVRQIMPSSVTAARFDFKNPSQYGINVSTTPTVNQQGAVPNIESYEYVGALGFKNRKDGDRLTRLRMEELEAVGKHFEGGGNNRYVLPGRWFRLSGHFDNNPYGGNNKSGKNEFLILDVRHTASNNYLQQADVKADYSNTLSCIRKLIPWRPGRSFNSIDTKILAPQTATVVGPSGPDSIYTDEYGRIRLQFHWDRIGNNDEKSSAWVRVTSSWAGAQLGAAAIPRVASEVIVQWLDGNPDRPIVTGGVFNEYNMPPWKLATQQALTGLRSRELTPNGGNSAGGRSNHLILDDTNQQIQVELKSDHQQSQLSLGYITRISGNSGRKDHRGEGWELRTDAWGALRATNGILLTAWGQAINDPGTTQQDNTEGTDTLRAVLDSAEARSQAAEMASEQRGSKGHSHRGLKSHRTLSENSWSLSKPIIFISAPDGVATSSPKSVVHAAGQDLGCFAAGNVDMTSGEIISLSAAKGIQQHVERGGMSTALSHGDYHIHVQDGKTEVVSKQGITFEAKSGDIVLKTKGGSIVLTESGEIQIKGANETHDIAGVIKLGASQVTNSGTVAAPPAKEFWGKMNVGKFSQRLILADALHMAAGVAAQYAYKVVGKDGAVLKTGKLSEKGKTDRVFTEDMEELHVEVDVNHGKWKMFEDIKHDLGDIAQDTAEPITVPVGLDILSEKAQLPLEITKGLFKNDGAIDPGSVALSVLATRTRLPAETIMYMLRHDGKTNPQQIVTDVVKDRVNEASAKIVGLIGGSWNGGEVPHDVRSMFEKANLERDAKRAADLDRNAGSETAHALPGTNEDIAILSESPPDSLEFEGMPADLRPEQS